MNKRRRISAPAILLPFTDTEHEILVLQGNGNENFDTFREDCTPSMTRWQSYQNLTEIHVSKNGAQDLEINSLEINGKLTQLPRIFLNHSGIDADSGMLNCHFRKVSPFSESCRLRAKTFSVSPGVCRKRQRKTGTYISFDGTLESCNNENHISSIPDPFVQKFMTKDNRGNFEWKDFSSKPPQGIEEEQLIDLIVRCLPAPVLN